MPNVVTNVCKLFVDDAQIFADVSNADTKLQEDSGSYHSMKLNTKCLHI